MCLFVEFVSDYLLFIVFVQEFRTFFREFLDSICLFLYLIVGFVYYFLIIFIFGLEFLEIFQGLFVLIRLFFELIR